MTFSSSAEAGGNRRIEKIAIDDLRSHERINRDRLESLIAGFQKEGQLTLPILVDETTRVILDGHHRHQALKCLGARVVPCLIVDYLNDSAIDLAKGPNCPTDSLSRTDILVKGQSNERFPPKSTRHRVNFTYPEVNIPLEELR